MKIVVTARDNKGSEAKLAAKFGRANYFAIVDTEDNSVNFIKNEAKTANSGAGVRAAQNVADLEADVLISGNIGPKAFEGLNKTELEIYAAEEKSIEAVIDDYNAEELEKLDSPTNQAHAGLS